MLNFLKKKTQQFLPYYNGALYLCETVVRCQIQSISRLEMARGTYCAKKRCSSAIETDKELPSACTWTERNVTFTYLSRNMCCVCVCVYLFVYNSDSDSICQQRQVRSLLTDAAAKVGMQGRLEDVMWIRPYRWEEPTIDTLCDFISCLCVLKVNRNSKIDAVWIPE